MVFEASLADLLTCGEGHLGHRLSSGCAIHAVTPHRACTRTFSISSKMPSAFWSWASGRIQCTQGKPFAPDDIGRHLLLMQVGEAPSDGLPKEAQVVLSNEA
jgi:hypothetical protein